MTPGNLYRITAPHFVAGVILRGGRVVVAAPILRFAMGWDGAKLAAYCRRKGWTPERLEPGTMADTPARFVVLVTGGRDYADAATVAHELGAIDERRPISKLVHGAARGADTLAGAWARQHLTPVESYPVDYALDGRWPAAGHRRNRRMLDASKPDLVVAFPGGRGTAGMVAAAIAAGVPVHYATPKQAG